MKGETFSQAVDRLLDLRRMLLAVDPILRGQRAYQEWKDAREREKAGSEAYEEALRITNKAIAQGRKKAVPLKEGE